MIKPIFSVYDSVARVFSDPFVSLNTDVAIRDFQRGCNDPNTNLFHHSVDYSFFQLGEFNDETGEITYYPQPINHGLASAFKSG